MIKFEMTQEIKCGKCKDSTGWDSYIIGGEVYIECCDCEQKIEGNFVINKILGLLKIAQGA